MPILLPCSSPHIVPVFNCDLSCKMCQNYYNYKHCIIHLLWLDKHKLALRQVLQSTWHPSVVQFWRAEKSRARPPDVLHPTHPSLHRLINDQGWKGGWYRLDQVTGCGRPTMVGWCWKEGEVPWNRLIFYYKYTYCCMGMCCENNLAPIVLFFNPGYIFDEMYSVPLVFRKLSTPLVFK